MSLQVVVDFQVVDESEDWLVVDKPAPLIVHPANRKPEPTLLGGVEQLLAFEMQNGARPAIVNRLDRDTSGLVIIAKHTAVARELGMIFEHRNVSKEYLAIVIGWPESNDWTVDEPILRAGEIGLSPIWVRQMIHPAGKPCFTRFRVEQRFERPEGRFALIRCFPETGRMHQIRVHLAHAGHPIAGDKIYSSDGSEYLEWMAKGWTHELATKLHLARHALHASDLKLRWRGELLHWQTPLSQDLKDFVAGRPYQDIHGAVIWSRHD